MSDVVSDGKTMLDIARNQRDRHGPAWCWDFAEECLHQRAGQSLQQFGQGFRDVHHYRTLCDHSEVGKRQAVILYPAIAAAEELNADAVKTSHLKVAVLGELDPKEVCQQFNIEEAVFQAWEKTFFDVRGCRSATHWVSIHVIQPELAAGRDELVARLRMVSAVGTLAAKAILQADTRLPICEAQKLFERQLKLHLKFDAAVEMTPGTNKNHLFFIRQHALLKLEERRLEFAREKLQKKCEEILDRHKLSMIQAEITLERERNRAAAIAQRAEGIALAKRGDEDIRKMLVARRREQELVEQAARAERIAASPLSRLRWRHRQEPGSNVSIPAEGKTVQANMPPVIVLPTVPLTVISPRSATSILAGAPM